MSHLLLLILNLLLTTISLAGTVLNFSMAASTRRRVRLIFKHAPKPILLITARRAFRMEVCFFLCQLVLFAGSIWSFFRVLPDAPPYAIYYYFGTQIGRSFVAAVLAVVSLLDLRDRHRLLQMIEV